MNRNSLQRTFLVVAAALLLAGGAAAGASLTGHEQSAGPARAEPHALVPSGALSEAPVQPAASPGRRQGAQAPPAGAGRPHPRPAAAANLQTAATQAPTPTGGAASDRTIHVDTHFTDAGELTDAQRVRCGEGQPGACEFQTGGHSTLTGTLTGWTDYTGWTHNNPDGSQTYYTHETFTGTVAGCGRGTFEFLSEDAVVESGPSSEDPSARDFHGPWTLVPGSGTGDLARLHGGSGEIRGVFYADTSTRGTVSGELTCGA